MEKGSRLLIRPTSTATLITSLPSRKPSVPAHENLVSAPNGTVRPNLSTEYTPHGNAEMRGQVSKSEEVLERQTTRFNHDRPARHPKPQLSPLAPFGKKNGIKERSEG